MLVDVLCSFVFGFDILSLCLHPLSPQLPVWVQCSHHHFVWQNWNSSPPSCSFTFHSAFNYFMQKYILSQRLTSPSMLPLPNSVRYLPVFIYSPENFLISNFKFCQASWSFPFFSVSAFRRLLIFVTWIVELIYCWTEQTCSFRAVFGLPHKLFRRFFYFSQFLTAISWNLWRQLATKTRTVSRCLKEQSLLKKTDVCL